MESFYAFQGAALDNFNKDLLKAINETVFGLLGQAALESLSKYLSERYSISPSEWPHHLDLILRVLGHCLGPATEKTVGRAIAKTFYFKLKMEFANSPSYSLIDYVEKAKLRMREDTSPAFHHRVSGHEKRG